MPAPGHESRSRWRKAGLGLLAVLLLAVLAYTGLFFVSGVQVEREIARLEQRFGNLGEGALAVEPVPPEDNRARLVREAAALLDRTHWETVSGSVSRYLTSESAQPVADDARAVVERNQAAMRLADGFVARSRSSYDVDYFAGDYPDLLAIRLLSDALAIDASIQLEAGRVDAASNRVRSALALCASFRQEPALLMQIMRMSLTWSALNGVEDLITRAEPTRQSLVEIARWLAENRKPAPMDIGLLGDLNLNVALLRRIDSGSASAPDAYRGAFHAWTKGPMRFLSRPVHRLALVHYLKDIAKLIDLQAGPRPRPAFEETPPAARWNLVGRLADDFSAGLLASIEAGDRFMSALAATQVGVALRAYRLDRGTYPPDLSALVPAYLPELPIDPSTGRPPSYSRDGAGFSIKTAGAYGQAMRRSAHIWVVPK